MANRKSRRSKGGRPRKAGARYPGGKLIPQRIEPNAKVLEERRHLMGSADHLERAVSPLDLMLARNWITEREHRAGVAFARIHAQSHLGGPRLDRGGPAEVTSSTSDVSKRGMQDWTDRETAEIFDAVFSEVRRSDDERASIAMAQHTLLCSILLAAERMAVLEVCTRAEMPQWVAERCAGRFDTPHERRRDDLVKGLGRLASALFTKTRAEPAGQEMRSFGEMNTAPAGKLIEEATDYVNTAGELLYTAVRRRRAVG